MLFLYATNFSSDKSTMHIVGHVLYFEHAGNRVAVNVVEQVDEEENAHSNVGSPSGRAGQYHDGGAAVRSAGCQTLPWLGGWDVVHFLVGWFTLGRLDAQPLHRFR